MFHKFDKDATMNRPRARPQVNAHAVQCANSVTTEMIAKFYFFAANFFSSILRQRVKQAIFAQTFSAELFSV